MSVLSACGESSDGAPAATAANALEVTAVEIGNVASCTVDGSVSPGSSSEAGHWAAARLTPTHYPFTVESLVYQFAKGTYSLPGGFSTWWGVERE